MSKYVIGLGMNFNWYLLWKTGSLESHGQVEELIGRVVETGSSIIWGFVRNEEIFIIITIKNDLKVDK